MDPRANWLLLANAALGNFLAGTASRIFAVSLPTVAASLDTTIVGIAWAVIAYQISQISLSLIFGRIGDIYGRHTLFGLGLVVSSIGALLCGLSQNVTQLILAGIVLTLINYWKGNVPQRSVSSESKGAIDYLGALLLIAATLTLISAIDYRIMESLAPPVRIALIVGFVLCFVGFIYREYTTASPILDLSLFRIRMFTLSALALLLVGVSQVMIGFLLPFYLQDVLHLKPTFIGLLFVSAPIFTVTLSPLVGWAVDKMGPRVPATAGIAFLAAAGFFGSFLRPDSHWTVAVCVLALWGLATALFFTSNHTAMIGSVPDRHRGVATGAIYVIFGLGTTFGVSLGTLLLTAAFRYYSGDPTATPSPTNPVVFVQSMNFSFVLGGFMALAAMSCSAMRGKRAVVS